MGQIKLFGELAVAFGLLDRVEVLALKVFNEGNFEKVWLRTRRGRKKLSVRFLAKLKANYPEYYTKAVQMNKRDNFVMWNRRERYRDRFNKKSKKTTKNANA